MSLRCGCRDAEQHRAIVDVSWIFAAQEGLSLSDVFRQLHEMMWAWPLLTKWAKDFQTALALQGLKISDEGNIVPLTEEEIPWDCP